MNGPLPEAVGWTRKRWGYTLGAAFVVQVGLLALLGRGYSVFEPHLETPTRITLVADLWLSQQLQRLPTFQDPTLFALPHLKSFSGSAWLRFLPPQTDLPDWSETNHWLCIDTNRLAAGLASLVKTGARPPLLVADMPPIRLTGTDPVVPNEPVPHESVLIVEGQLADRPFLAPPPLPSWPHADILSNTIVRVAVDAAGEPLTAVLLAGSGLAAADQYALQMATTARFAAGTPGGRGGVDPGPPAWGRLVFRWHTLPANTNTPAVAP